MGLTKLDRQTLTSVQSSASDPVAGTTRGNIAISGIGPQLYYQYGSAWYPAGGGVFTYGTGTSSAKRAGVAGLAASGDYSFAMGDTNTASGDYSFVGGQGNTASGSQCVAFGNGTSVAGTSCFGAGSSLVIQGGVNNFVGGKSNSILGSSAEYNTVFGESNLLVSAASKYNLIAGESNTINLSTSVLVAGSDHSITSAYSFTFGNDNENAEDYTMVYGRYAKAIWAGARHFAGVRMDGSTSGSSQGLDGLVLSAQTTGVESIKMTLGSLDGTGTNPLFCPDGHTILVGVRLIGISSAGINVYDWNLIIDRKDPSFNATGFDFGGDLTTGTPSDPIWSKGTSPGTISVVEDAINYKAEITVTGVAATTTNWTAHLYKGISMQGSYHYAGS